MGYAIAVLEKEIYLIEYRIKNDLVSQGNVKDLRVHKEWLQDAINKLKS